DLSKDYMFRMCLFQLEAESFELVGVFHHISSDGWSNGILVREFASLYHSFKSGRGSELDPLPIQYSDYAIWQRKYLEGEVLENQLTYWEDKLEGVSTLSLPTHYV
ncbi:hypothetical protein J9332_39265, partial [Aquimarina celericrescens]|nr:hypothetical protein [Aquimarina celericrescens]